MRYDDDNYSSNAIKLQELNDKLARIACKALEHIEQTNDGLEFVLMKDPEIHEWWMAHKKADRAAAAALEKKQKEAEIREARRKLKQEVLSRLTTEEIKALGVKL